MYHVEVVWGWGGRCCRFVSCTFDVMMFLLPTHAFVVHCPPDRSWLPMCEPPCIAEPTDLSTPILC